MKNKAGIGCRLMAGVLTLAMAISAAGCEITSHLGEAVYEDAYAKIFVSPDGDDQNPGTWQKPVESLEKARDMARELREDMDGDIQIVLEGGVYTLDETFRLDDRDGGLNGYNIVYMAAPGEEAILSGGRPVTGWSLFDADKNIYSAPYGGAIETRQLYVNGQRATRARSDGGLSDATYDETGHTTTDTFLADFQNCSDMEMVYQEMWTNSRCMVDSITVSDGVASIVMQQPGWLWCRNKGGTSSTTPWYYENAYELLDTPGEWYLDRTGAIGGEAYTFYYMPREGEDLSTAQVTVPVLETLVSIEGRDIDHPAANITFQGLTFQEATWNDPSIYGLADVQNNVLREKYDPDNPAYLLDDYKYDDRMTEGNLKMRLAVGITWSDCTFRRLGNTALYMDKGCQDNEIVGCTFYDGSAGGVQIGDIDMYDTDNWNPSDQRLILRGNSIHDNYMHHLGVEYRSAAAIGLGYIVDTDVSHNELAYLPYSGIHMGWGWKRMRLLGVACTANNRIEYNYIHDVMTELYDGGAIYLLGGQQKNGHTVIAHNFLQRQEGQFAAIYLDEAVDFVDVYENVIDTAPNWICSKNVNNTIYDNFTNQAARINDPDPDGGPWGDGKAELKNTTLVTDGNWGEEALAIMEAAGVTDRYHGEIPLVGAISFDTGATEDTGELAVLISSLRHLPEEDLYGFIDGGSALAGQTVIGPDGAAVTLDDRGFALLGAPLTAEQLSEMTTSKGGSLPLTVQLSAGQHSLTLGLATGSGEVLLSGDISVATGYVPIVADDYEGYALDAVPENISFNPDLGGASITQDPQNPENQVLEITHPNTASPSFLVSYDFPETGGLVAVEMDILPTATNAAIYAPYIRTGSTEIVSINVNNNGYISYNNGTTVVPCKTYTANTWVRIKVVLDLNSQQYALYADGILLQSGLVPRAATETVDNVCVGMYWANAGSYYVDNLRIKAIS